MMSKKIKVASVIGLLLLVYIAWFGAELIERIPQSPELALQSFYEREVAEDQIMDPLILAGPGVVPLLEKEISKPEMPNRRYAIGALGILKGKAALPKLDALARAKSEEDYMRCDALVAIGMIDSVEGRRIARSVKGEVGCVSEIMSDQDYARWLKLNAPKRTYFEAFLGRHD